MHKGFKHFKSLAFKQGRIIRGTKAPHTLMLCPNVSPPTIKTGTEEFIKQNQQQWNNRGRQRWCLGKLVESLETFQMYKAKGEIPILTKQKRVFEAKGNPHREWKEVYTKITTTLQLHFLVYISSSVSVHRDRGNYIYILPCTKIIYTYTDIHTHKRRQTCSNIPLVSVPISISLSLQHPLLLCQNGDTWGNYT